MTNAHPNRLRHGFTLIELLVVIGIVVLVMGLLLVGVARSYKAGVRARQSADLTLLATALEAYKADFQDYPRFDQDTSNKPGPNFEINRGAVLLCRSLLGPAPAVATATSLWNPAGGDGADGNGFRTRPGGAGTVYGPYIQPEKFTIGPVDGNSPDNSNYTNMGLLDRSGNPILYLPAAQGATNLTQTGGYVSSVMPTGNVAVTTGSLPLYNAFDVNNGTTAFYTNDIYKILNADPSTGEVVSTGMNTAATYTGPYILWTSGPDGIYGFDKNGKTDDITNFDIPPNLRK